MRMNLKNRNKKYKRISIKNIRFNSKNLFIFLISLSIVSFILGIISFFLLNSIDQNTIGVNIDNYFKIKNNYSFLNLIFSNLTKNTFNIFLIWILGLSVIGIFLVIIIYFCELFSIGFSIGAIFSKYGLKGIIGSFCYLFPSKICFSIILFIITFFAIKISYKIVKLCFYRSDTNLKEEMNRYFKVLLFSFIIIIFITLLQVFIDPFFIKLFTNIK